MSLIPFSGNCPHNVNKDAKYHVKSRKGDNVIELIYNTPDGEKWYATNEEHPELVEMVNNVHTQARGVPNGSFYINEYKQVIVPNGDEGPYYYAGRYEQPLRFEFEGHILSGDHVNPDGQPLESGNSWLGPHPGIPYILCAGGTDIKYTARPRPKVAREIRLSSFIGKEKANQVARMIVQHRGLSGGRFYVNEFQAIFGPVSEGEEWISLYMGRLDLNSWFPMTTPE